MASDSTPAKGPELRVPMDNDRDLYDALGRWAAAEDRSVAAQVRAMLRRTIPADYLKETP